MINKIKLTFRNSPFRTKIITISLISGLFPLLLLAVIASFIISYNLTQNERSQNEEYLSAAVLQLDTKISTFNDALNYLMNNQVLMNGLSPENITNYNLYNYYSNEIVPLFNAITDQHPDIQQITLYSSANIYNHGTYVKKIQPDDITADFTVNKTIKPVYHYDTQSQKLFCYVQIFNKYQELNFLVFQLDDHALFKDLTTLSQDRFKISVKTNQGQNIFEFSTLNKKNQHSFVNDFMNNFDLGIITGKNQLSNHWQLTFSKPKQDIFIMIMLVFISAFLIFILLLVLIFFTTRALSKTVTVPIDNLVTQMNTITNTNMDLTYKYEAEDEIGQLYQSFEDMLQKIKGLIEEIYNSEIKQQKLEMQALQAQINPHFFYNSLSLINNKAILIKNKEISEMAQLLSNYYRLSLNQGSSIILVKKELELTLTYAKIQERMHSFSFDLIIDIDPSVNDVTMINLLLQPFVENAIFHGIDHIEDDRKGVLAIRAQRYNNRLLFEIFDNGAGMSSDKVATIFSSPGKHYGVQNVLKRIQLYYGEEGRISLCSYPNEGTFVQLDIPVKKPEFPAE